MLSGKWNVQKYSIKFSKLVSCIEPLTLHPMYFTSLPDHTKPGFDEQAHFGKFKTHNVIFNALSSGVHCDHHVGCLSLKTVLQGEEWYGVNHRHVALRPSQFLI